LIFILNETIIRYKMKEKVMATQMMIEVMEKIVKDQSEANMHKQLSRLTSDELDSLGRLFGFVEAERMDREYRYMDEGVA